MRSVKSGLAAEEAGQYADFVAAGQKCGTTAVFLTLLATVFGASATLGVAARAESDGFTAAWWLLSGAVGLALQGVFLSARLRQSGARTLPELARIKVGVAAQRLTAAVIGLSWVGVVAAQLVAFGDLWKAIAGTADASAPMAICALTVIAYTLAGGQRAVIRTDAPQMAVLAAGFGFLFLWVFTGRCGGSPVPAESIRLFSDGFGPRSAALSLLTVGGAYFLGPDIASRALVAKDGRTAAWAAVAAAPVLAVFGAAIALTGMWAGANAPGAGNPVIRLATRMPAPLALCLYAGLVCALVSSLDTCLMNAGAIVAGDFLGFGNVRGVRIALAAIGAAALALALTGCDIIGILLAAYSFYVPGVVCPLAVAILAGRVARPRLWLAAVAAGGAFGLAGALAPSLDMLPAVGMALSLALALASAPPLARQGLTRRA